MSLDYRALLNDLGLENSDGEQQVHLESPRKASMVINISLTQDIEKQLCIYENQQVSDAVYEFCRQNQLSQVAYEEILNQIEQSLQPRASQKTPERVSSKQEFVEDDGDFEEQRPTDVYERLYKKAINKQKQQQEIDETPRLQNNYQLQEYYGSKTNKLPPGQRLYNFCQKKQKEKETQMNRIRDQDQKEEQYKLTFQPQINEMSNLIVQQMGYHTSEDHFKRLTSNKKEENLETTKILKEKHKFQPQISEISRQLATFMKYTREFDNVYDQLYYDAKLKQREKSLISHQKDEKSPIPPCTFKPTINVTSSRSQYSFLERVQLNLEQKKTKLEYLKNKHNLIDFNTGKLLYQPSVGRPPKINQKTHDNVFDSLYQQAVILEEKLQQLKQEDQKEFEMQMARCGEHSDDLVYESRKQGIRNIFLLLDNKDQDGVVHCSRSEIQNLPPQHQILLTPFFNQLKNDYPKGIEFEDFFEALYKFTQSLPQNEKDFLLIQKRKKSTVKSKDYTYKVKLHYKPFYRKPIINQKSRQICKNKQEYTMCKCQVCRENSELSNILGRE